MTRKLALAAVLATAVAVNGAASTGGYVITADSLRAHVAVLAADSLEGRKVGEIGEQKASRYIIGVMQAAGLKPGGDNGGWTQAFEFTKRIDRGERNSLTVNGVPLVIDTEYVPLLQSGNGAFAFDGVVDAGYGIVYPEHGYEYDDYEGIDAAGKLVLVRRYAPKIDDSTINLERYSSLTDKINAAVEHKAKGLIVITPENQDDTLLGSSPVHITPKDIPVIFLRRAALQKLGLSIEAPDIRTMSGDIELVKVRDTGYNVVGVLPGESDTAMIVGGHYDHLGW